MDAEARTRRLDEISQSLQNGQPEDPIPVRELIGWFDALRRGVNVNWNVRRALDQAGLITTPDFEGSHIDGSVSFALRQAQPPEGQLGGPNAGADQQPADPAVPEEAQVLAYVGGAGVEPAYRVSRLLDPNLRLLSIAPDAPLQEAATLMLLHDYSQLPVMTNDRDVRGVIGWDTIGPALTLSQPGPRFVRDCMKQHVEVRTTDSIFQVINRVIENSYVLVRNEHRIIVAILTTTDLSQQFQDLAEPFLLLGEIENHIRALVDGRFTQPELMAARNENDPGRQVESVADLSLGEHARLIQNAANWTRLQLQADRAVFARELETIRLLRNDVMHFDSDRITVGERNTLRNFVQFLHYLKLHQPAPVEAQPGAR